FIEVLSAICITILITCASSDRLTRRTAASLTGVRDRSFLLVPVLRDVAAVAVILERQEFSRHRDLDAVALRVRQALHLQVKVDRRHDTVAEFLLDQCLRSEERRVGKELRA